MNQKIFLFSALFSLCFLIVVLEFVRTKKIKEQYSLLWLLIGSVMIILALWRELLEHLAKWVGIYYAPSLLFMVGILFCFILILHYSVIISRLYNQNVILAQEIGLLNKKIKDIECGSTDNKRVKNNKVNNVQ